MAGDTDSGKSTQVTQFILEVREVVVMVVVVMNGGGVMKGADDSWQEHSGSSVHPGGERDCSNSDQGDKWGQ